MTKADAKYVAEIHCEALAGDFLPCIGKSFLTSLYKNILVVNIGFGIVYERNNNILGAVVATEDTDIFYRTLFLKRFWALVPKMMLPLLKHPSLIKRTFETVFLSKRLKDKTGPKAELMVICLRKTFHRQGIGAELVQALNDEFKRHGVLDYAVRVYDDNKTANKFYEKNRFKLDYSYIMYGKKCNVYKCNVN